MEEKYERYIPVEQSIIGSFKEIKAMREGKLRGTTWNEFMEELKKEEKLERENAGRTDKALQRRF